MSENIVIYAGLKRIGIKRKQALEREAKRSTTNGSVSALVWQMFKKHGSAQFKTDIAAAEKAED